MYQIFGNAQMKCTYCLFLANALGLKGLLAMAQFLWTSDLRLLELNRGFLGGILVWWLAHIYEANESNAGQAHISCILS